MIPKTRKNPRQQSESTKSGMLRNGVLFMSSDSHKNENDDVEVSEKNSDEVGPAIEDQKSTNMFAPFSWNDDPYMKPPSPQVEDANLLFYDVLLILNLSLSISFWVVHRMSIDFIGSAVGEGSLMCILWIAAGLYNGAFLYSAVDGHYGSSSDKGGPRAAGFLGLQTFIGTVNLRICVALVMAILEHRKVGVTAAEQLVPLEIVFGLVLMSMWRALHSYSTPRT